MGISILQLGCSVFGIRSEENPKYSVIQKEDDKEIRSYSPYIVAKTVLKGDFKEVQNDSFRILAGYIFGKNERKQQISMTAPVRQEQETIAMTAPVVQREEKEGWAMTFMMPSQYKLADLPTPLDKRIVLEEVPAKIYGVIRYSGYGKAEKNQSKAAELRAWLGKLKDYEAAAGASFAGYDPPWTLPFLRKNEMLIELHPRK